MAALLDMVNARSPLDALLSRELEAVAAIFDRQLLSDVCAVNTLCEHIEQYRGKMLRPTLVVLSGLAAGGPPCDGSALRESHRVVAAVVEMIHMATLVHDDVLDEAQLRRRGTTVNRLRGNEAAVMLGDYLISNSFHLCSSLNEPWINVALGDVTNTLCEGELIQLHHRQDYGIDEATYFEVVRRKTASLIAESCRLGALLSGADEDMAAALWHYGLSLGVAFQIQDDLLDLLGRQSVVGKSLGRDLETAKMTLPLIRHLAAADQAERGAALQLIEQRDADALRDRLTRSGAAETARQTANDLVIEASTHLMTLPDTAARELLDSLARALIDRRF